MIRIESLKPLGINSNSVYLKGKFGASPTRSRHCEWGATYQPLSFDGKG